MKTQIFFDWRDQQHIRRIGFKLENLGHRVILSSLLEIVPIADAAIPDEPYQLIAMTSANGARALSPHPALSKLHRLPAFTVGPQSIARIHAAIDDAATLVWNGPLGAFEMTPFDHGTMVAAKHAANRTKAKKLISVAGGGDTVAALNQAGVAGDFTYVSTAGGAFLEWMEGKPLPGVEVLRMHQAQ